jgi:hypothetical protein
VKAPKNCKKNELDLVKCRAKQINVLFFSDIRCNVTTRSVDKSLARPGRKQATATEDFDFRISYL